MRLDDLVKSVCLSGEGVVGAEKCLPYIAKYMPMFGVSTPRQQAEFLAQCAHESAGFRILEENLNYSADGLAKTWPKRYADSKGRPNEVAMRISRKPEAIANNVYANRMGNGDENSGDGWHFRGRGAIQLTGRENYTRIASETGLDCVNHPEILAAPEGAIVSACWFWKKLSLGSASSFLEQTKRINGGTNGFADRQARLTAALSLVIV